MGVRVYQLGMKEFADNPRFVLSFAQCLVEARNVDAAMRLLRQSIARVEKAEDKQRVWERLVEVSARFQVTRPVGEMLALEEEWRKELPNDENACVLSDLTRYTLWGVGVARRTDD